VTHPRSIHDDLPGLSHCPECGAELEAVDVGVGTAQDGQDCYCCNGDAEYQWLDIRDPIRQACCREHMKVGVAGERTVEIADVEPRSEK
jgi:hypothetical protein